MHPSFVVTGKLQAVKTSAPSEVRHFLWHECFLQRKSWEDDLFRALNTRLDKCNDIQMSTIILCLWGVLSNWILIKYWVRETSYLIMKAAPLLPSSGEPAVCSTEWALWIRDGCRECLYTVHKSMSTVLVGVNWCKVPVEGETCIQMPCLTLYLLFIYGKTPHLV